jgi:mannose-1-phosphate guanylyltransferase/mannose-6-phosphate isomerase
MTNDARSHQAADGLQVFVENLDWPSVYDLAISLVNRLGEAQYVPDHVVAVYDPESSGGYVVAAHLVSLIGDMLSHRRPDISSITIEGRAGHRVVTTMPAISPDARRILIVDDVSWTGRTVQLARQKILEQRPVEVRGCALVVGPPSVELGAVDFYARVSKARDVQFPWGVVAPTSEFRQTLGGTHANDRSVTWTPRPWGFWEQFVLNESCTVRILTILPGECLSLQFHRERDELFVALDDGLVIQIDDKRRVFNRGDYVTIPRLTVHRHYAPMTHAVRVLEIAFGDYDQAGDIVRLHDKYGRSLSDGAI